MAPADLERRDRRHALIDVRLALVCHRLLGMMKYYGVPAWVAMATGWVIIAIQHGNEDSLLYEEHAWTPAKGQIVSTFDTRFPGWLELLWCKINFHIRTTSPGIP